MFRILTLLFILHFGTFGFGQTLPSSFKKCPAINGEDNQCLKAAIKDAIVFLSDYGAPELDAASLDPLYIPEIDIKQDGNVNLNMKFTKCHLSGSRMVQIQNVGGNLSSPETFSMKANGVTPILQLTGPYQIKGKVLILPVNGAGRSNLTLTNVKAEVRIKGSQQLKNGKRYLKINSFRLNLKDISRLYFNFERVINGDKRLSDSTNAFLNQNWQSIYSDLRPAISQGFGKVLEEYTKKIMENVPFDDIFIPN